MEIIAKNRKAFFEYEIIEKVEAGIVLTGTEVKSIRNRDVSINESFALLEKGEIFIHNMHVGLYKQGNRQNHEPGRARKLLLHKKEINKIAGRIKQKGYTMVPLSMYMKEGFIKIELALVRGKSKIDKREDIKKRIVERSIQRAMR
ncbi:MAG: SsrA-binding protein SmpB [Candidatus Loosdrechtia sp.]|uniref:SsrA-binding protein n=1 Tax=Candidatus Loosdrechtia sp. TaxID=3101272 RepID=UPI003A674773|nr:MAG: SsrA-binding protein SmpB [Candidatus Jettenia sp. AMX2]